MSVTISGSGQIIKQVVQVVKTDYFVSTGTSLQTIPSFSVSITPTNSANKILIVADIFSSTTNSFEAVFLRNGSAINVPTTGSITNGSFGQVTSTVATGIQISHQYLDSPATTSAITYSVGIQSDAGTMYVNRRGNDTYFGYTSTLTVYEVAYA